MSSLTVQKILPNLETTEIFLTYRSDLRTNPPDIFKDESRTDWRSLSRDDVGKPYRVENYSRRRKEWEREQDREMPVPVQWEYFNRHFHELFISDVSEKQPDLIRRLGKSLAAVKTSQAAAAMRELTRLRIWNHVHRVEDAVWDPRGKRALFEGLDLNKPEILFLGAADGYEAMQLLAMYPGGHAVLVDYDDFCRTDRFGKFPESYPFLGRDPATGSWRIYRKEDMALDFEVADIRDLNFSSRFDVVISVGLVEHFPDEYKPLVFEFHRRFLKPHGYAIITTPRKQLRSKLFYLAMGELMNYGYRELMDARQLGFYTYENGFDILRCGYIKAHNGVVAKLR